MLAAARREPHCWCCRLGAAADTVWEGSSALIIPSTLICSYTKSCCLKLVNQLSVKPQNVSDCGLNLLPWHMLPSAAFPPLLGLCCGEIWGQMLSPPHQGRVNEASVPCPYKEMGWGCNALHIGTELCWGPPSCKAAWQQKTSGSC